MDHPLSIRPATDADHPALWAMLAPVFRAGDTYAIEANISRADALAYWCGGTHIAFLAEAEAPLGTYYLCPNQRGGGAHVCNAGFVASPAARGRGIARQMLAHAEATAILQGFRAMQFNFVVATNRAARHIWSTAGFTEVGRVPGAFRHPTEGYVDALVLHKHLTEEP